MKRICFFSSDARPLYKRDVFRALSYPNDFVIHFRYQFTHVDVDISSIANQKGIIFLSVGNDLTKQESERVITHVSIREITVIGAEKTEDTGLFHFYLKLGDFKTFHLQNNPQNILPPIKLVAALEVNEGQILAWHNLIDSIKTSFPSQLFYKFQMYNGSNLLPPRYNEIEKQSYYSIMDESSYKIEMSFYDTELNSSNNYHSVKVTTLNEKNLKIVAPIPIDIEARRDNRTYSLVSETISPSKLYTYLNFETMLKNIDANSSTVLKTIVDSTVKFEIIKSTNRTFSFAFNSILAAAVVAYAKMLCDQIDFNGFFSWNLTLQFILITILGFKSAYSLYRLFDKK